MPGEKAGEQCFDYAQQPEQGSRGEKSGRLRVGLQPTKQVSFMSYRPLRCKVLKHYFSIKRIKN
jgi:hypothetical protein